MTPRSAKATWAGASLIHSQGRDAIGGQSTPGWSSSLYIDGKSPVDPQVIKAAAPCTKRIEPEEITPAPTGDVNRLLASTALNHSRLEDQSPSYDGYSPSPVTDAADHHVETDRTPGGQHQRKSCWGNGKENSVNRNSWDTNTSSESSSPFRVPKALHGGDAQKLDFPKESGLWNSGSAFTSTGQETHKSGEKTWASAREAEECVLSGRASKSLTFGSHGLKQENFYDDLKHPSDYPPYGATSNPSVVSAANPFACPITGASSSFGYSYAPMFAESKAYGAGWNDPYVDSHYSQFPGTVISLILSKICVSSFEISGTNIFFLYF